MVEIEIGVLRGHCLDRRIDDTKRLRREIAAWQRQRNATRARIKWMFTTDKARAKMGHAYPDAKESQSLCWDIGRAYEPDHSCVKAARLRMPALTEVNSANRVASDTVIICQSVSDLTRDNYVAAASAPTRIVVASLTDGIPRVQLSLFVRWLRRRRLSRRSYRLRRTVGHESIQARRSSARTRVLLPYSLLEAPPTLSPDKYEIGSSLFAWIPL
jgi:hypothetical protein